MKFAILLLAATVFAGVETASAQTPMQVTVKIGRDKKDTRSKLSVKFVSVEEDSRCPEGANCIWAGNARITIKVRKSAGAWKSFELNTGRGPETITFGGFELKLTSLTPTPKSDAPTDKRRYIATISIMRL